MTKTCEKSKIKMQKGKKNRKGKGVVQRKRERDADLKPVGLSSGRVT
jgi:hypothetical protein